MGIQGLTKLLGDCAPSCMKENEIKNYFGRIFILWYFGCFIMHSIGETLEVEIAVKFKTKSS